MAAVKPVENYGASIGDAVMRAKVYRLESEIAKLPQVDCPVRNFFAEGLYAREMTLPAGTVITGAVHKAEHITIISKGRVQVVRQDGVQEFCAPCIFISPPNTKNAVHVIEDAVWTTFHPNTDNERDMDVLVERYTTSKNSELLGNRQLDCDHLKKLEGE